MKSSLNFPSDYVPIFLLLVVVGDLD